jgi:hypothetical protein
MSEVGQPARKQAKTGSRPYASSAPPKDNATYNVWFHKYTGDGEDDHRAKMREERLSRWAQLDIERDCGVTRGSKMIGRKPYICLHFARGECDQGSECLFLHRLPNADDERSVDCFHDVFGREKHRDERDDMTGVGSFNREGKTLYVGGLQNARARKMEQILDAYFGTFGEINNIRVIYEKSIAFVRFNKRICAEFAKEATNERPLLVGRERKEVLTVKWANDDPNPVSQQQEVNRQIDIYNAAMFRWWSNLQSSDQNYYQYQEYLHRLQQSSAAGDKPYYPDTNHQYTDQQNYYEALASNPEYLQQVQEAYASYYQTYPYSNTTTETATSTTTDSSTPSDETTQSSTLNETDVKAYYDAYCAWVAAYQAQFNQSSSSGESVHANENDDQNSGANLPTQQNSSDTSSLEKGQQQTQNGV